MRRSLVKVNGLVSLDYEARGEHGRTVRGARFPGHIPRTVQSECSESW